MSNFMTGWSQILYRVSLFPYAVKVLQHYFQTSLYQYSETGLPCFGLIGLTYFYFTEFNANNKFSFPDMMSIQICMSRKLLVNCWHIFIKIDSGCDWLWFGDTMWVLVLVLAAIFSDMHHIVLMIYFIFILLLFSYLHHSQNNLI